MTLSVHVRLPYFSDHKTHHDFSLDILEKIMMNVF